MRFEARALVRLLATAGLLSTIADTALADDAAVKFVLGQETPYVVKAFGCLDEEITAIMIDSLRNPKKYNFSEADREKMVLSGRCANISGHFYVAAILSKANQTETSSDGLTLDFSLIVTKTRMNETVFTITQNPVIGRPISDDYLKRVLDR